MGLQRGAVQTGAAAMAYLLITLGVTWPLAPSLQRSVAWDLGDSLYVMWAVDWGCTQLSAILGGDVSRLAGLFDAGVFHPAPLALAHSDHMLGQAVLALPACAVSGNPILVYNLLFLSTFVLCGLGMFLFVRALTGRPGAAFVAGLLFALAPYRLSHLSHLNLLSMQWLPFALFGIRRYLDTGRRLMLAGAALALAWQGYSSGYYLLLFTPVAALYAGWEVHARGRWRDGPLWRDLSVAAGCTALLLLPAVYPYWLLTKMLPEMRQPVDLLSLSADVWAWATAPDHLWLWGGVLRAYPRPEGALFPGAVVLLLAAASLVAWVRGAWSQRTDTAGTRGRLALGLVAAGGLLCTAACAVVVVRRVDLALGPFTLRVVDVMRPFALAVAAWLAALALHPGLRSAARRLLTGPEAWAVGLVIAAWWCALGPSPMAGGRPVGLVAPYIWLADWVPGFEGMRAPGRFAAVVVLGLSVLAGLGLARLPRVGLARAVWVLAALAVLVDTRLTRFHLDVQPPVAGLASPPGALAPPADAPPVYAAVRELPAEAVLAELPLGQPDWDRRAMYHTMAHRRPLANGYSSFYPPHYPALVRLAARVQRDPEPLVAALTAQGVTHLLVHEAAYPEGAGSALSRRLRELGAREVRREGPDLLLRLSRGRRLSTAAGGGAHAPHARSGSPPHPAGHAP